MDNPLYDEVLDEVALETEDVVETKQSDNSEHYLKLIEEQNRRIQELESKMQPLPLPEKEMTEEEKEALSEQIRERFYSNPLELFNEIKREAIEEAKREMENAKKDFDDFKRNQELDIEIKTVSNKHKDFFDYQDQMTKLLDERPEIANLPNSLETLYFIAKGMTNDIDVKQVSKNEKVKNEVIKNYVNEKNQPNAKVMGNQPRGNYASNIPDRVTSISQGGKLFRDYLRQQGLL